LTTGLRDIYHIFSDKAREIVHGRLGHEQQGIALIYIYNYIVPWFRGKSPSREALLRKIEGREIGHARYTPKKQNTP
jgi:hypothetical protein